MIQNLLFISGVRQLCGWRTPLLHWTNACRAYAFRVRHGHYQCEPCRVLYIRHHIWFARTPRRIANWLGAPAHRGLVRRFHHIFHLCQRNAHPHAHWRGDGIRLLHPHQRDGRHHPALHRPPISHPIIPQIKQKKNHVRIRRCVTHWFTLV